MSRLRAALLDLFAKEFMLCIILPKPSICGARSPDWERTNAMRIQPGLLRLSWLLSTALTLGVGTAAGAQEDHSKMKMDTPAQAASGVKPSMWSNPKSWPDGKVPGA